jgi:hypothetical protein
MFYSRVDGVFGPIPHPGVPTGVQGTTKLVERNHSFEDGKAQRWCDYNSSHRFGLGKCGRLGVQVARGFLEELRISCTKRSWNLERQVGRRHTGCLPRVISVDVFSFPFFFFSFLCFSPSTIQPRCANDFFLSINRRSIFSPRASPFAATEQKGASTYKPHT